LPDIFACGQDQAFYSCGIYPSATIICKGFCEMGLGYGDPNGLPPDMMGPLYLNEGSYYQILSPYEWNYLRPIKESCITLTVMESPFESQSRQLTKQEIAPLFEYFASSANRAKLMDMLEGTG